MENEGKNIYLSNCASCHGATNGLPGEIASNNGLDINSPDPGMGAQNASMQGIFKVPTLRNITLTAPYMHDGRYQTLEEVIEHYNSGGFRVENTDPLIRPLGLSPQQKADLLAFLHTFSDTSFLSKEAFSNPF